MVIPINKRKAIVNPQVNRFNCPKKEQVGIEKHAKQKKVNTPISKIAIFLDGDFKMIWVFSNIFFIFKHSFPVKNRYNDQANNWEK